LLQKLIARQIAHPSGLFGRLFTARWLDKANARMNQLTRERLAIKPEDIHEAMQREYSLLLAESGAGAGGMPSRVETRRPNPALL
jgi:hypothetical protein